MELRRFSGSAADGAGRPGVARPNGHSPRSPWMPAWALVASLLDLRARGRRLGSVGGQGSGGLISRSRGVVARRRAASWPGGIPNKIPTCYEASLPFPIRIAPSFLTDEHFTWQPSCIGIFPQHVGPFLDFSEVYGAFVMQLHNLLLDRLLSHRILTNLFAAQRTVKNEHAESDSIFVELIGDRCLRSSRSWRAQCFTFGKQCGIIVLLY